MWLRFVFHVAKIGYFIDKIHFSPLKERKVDYSWPLLSMGISDIWFVFGFVKRSWLFYFWFRGSLGCEARRAFFLFFFLTLEDRFLAWFCLLSLCLQKEGRWFEQHLQQLQHIDSYKVFGSSFCNILQHFATFCGSCLLSRVLATEQRWKSFLQDS